MLSLDPELLGAYTAMAALMNDLPPFPQGREDWRAVRTFAEASRAVLESGLPAHAAVTRTDTSTVSFDGARIGLRWYAPPGHDARGSGPAAVHLHGGGMIAATVDLYDRVVASYVAEAGVPMVAVDYRRAPEHPHPAPVEDCFAGLVWLREHAADLGIDPARLGVMGDSSGGGLAAATALLARERAVPLALQLLIYPMLDDRTTTPDPLLVPFAGWTYDNNYIGWRGLLGDAIGTDGVPPTAAPARATDLVGLANAYVEVGELDIFRDESVEYARRLLQAGVTTELHVHRGCPHGFDVAGAGIAVVTRARADRIRTLQSL